MLAVSLSTDADEGVIAGIDTKLESFTRMTFYSLVIAELKEQIKALKRLK